MWKQHKCLSLDKWINKMCNNHTKRYNMARTSADTYILQHGRNLKACKVKEGSQERPWIVLITYISITGK